MGTLNLLKNNKGETLVVVLISGFLLLSVFLIALPAITNHMKGQKQQFSRPNTCSNFTSSVMNRIRANGIQTKVYRAPIRHNSVHFSNVQWLSDKNEFDGLNDGGVRGEQGLPDALVSQRWPSKKVMAWNNSTNKFVSHSPRLIFSSMNLLSTIYNAYTSQVCGSKFGMMIYKEGPLYTLVHDENMDDFEEEGFEVNGSIRIRPFDFKTGEILPCSSPINIRPYANTEPPEAHAFGFADFSNYAADIGFEVEIFGQVSSKVDPEQAQLESGSSNQPQCSVVEKFQYDFRNDNINPPVVTINSGGVEIEIPNLRSGSFLSCKYESGAYSSVQKRVVTYPNGNRDWGPCDTMRICGETPSSVDINEEPGSITMNINRSLPSDCLMTVHAVVFDGVGNLSNKTVMNNRSGGGPAQNIDPDNSDSGQGFEVGGVEFGSFSAASQAAAMTGQSINTLSYDVTTVNDSRMNNFSGAMNNAQTALGAAQAAVGGLGSPGNSVSSASAAVSAAQAAVSSAQAAVSAATSAETAASSMSSMAEIGEVASQAAADTKSEAEAALAEAEAALAEAQEALEAAQEAEDDNGDDP